MKPRAPVPFYCRTGDKAWPYETIVPMAYQLGLFDEDYYVHAKSTGQLLGSLLSNGLLVIQPGYRFDGATAAPDIKRMMPAILLHDFLCQCCEHWLWPIERHEADHLFLRVAKEDAAPWSRTFYGFIRVFGGLHRAVFPPKPAAGITITTIEPA